MGAVIGWLMIGAIVAIVAWRYLPRGRAGEYSGSPAEHPPGIPHFEGNGGFEFDIVGEGSYQDALDAIAGGKTDEGHEFEELATLIREPNNPHDKNAIAVLISGRKVGYVARREAASMAKIIDKQGISQFTVDALILGGWDRSRRGQGHYGVKLDLPV